MPKNVLKMLVGGLVILVHSLSFYCIFWAKRQYIPDSERLDLALILMPVTAAYLTAIVGSAIRHQGDFTKGPSANANYVFVLVSITILFSLALLFITFGYPQISGPTIKELRRWLLVLEIAFGSSFGLFIEDLFGKAPHVAADQQEIPSPKVIGQ